MQFVKLDLVKIDRFGFLDAHLPQCYILSAFHLVCILIALFEANIYFWTVTIFFSVFHLQLSLRKLPL